MLVVLRVLPERFLFALGDDARHEERHAHKRQVVNELIRFHARIGAHPRQLVFGFRCEFRACRDGKIGTACSICVRNGRNILSEIAVQIRKREFWFQVGLGQ